jgi:NADPH-dependent curcumin reductase CurA
MVVAMRIKMQGFIVFDEVANFPAFRKQLTQWLTEGKLKRRQTILKGGLAAAPKGLIDLYKGVNTGKLLVEINSEAVAEVSKNSGLKL